MKTVGGLSTPSRVQDSKILDKTFRANSLNISAFPMIAERKCSGRKKYSSNNVSNFNLATVFV